VRIWAGHHGVAEGRVVLTKSGNADGGKAPWFKTDAGSGEARRLGNLATPDSVQKLQSALHAKAKGEPGYRFYLLYDKLYRADVLEHAYRSCQANKGAAGVDGQRFEDIEAYGVERWLGELAHRLKTRTYEPQAVKRVWIEKPNSDKLRPLGIPAIVDRVVQTAALLVLDPIFEADLAPQQYAYRRDRGAHDAVRTVHSLLNTGHTHVVDADLSGYLDRASQCPQVHDGRLKRSGCWTTALILRPFCRPRRMITASNSPRFTRCNTVWRDTPSRCVATCIAT